MALSKVEVVEDKIKIVNLTVPVESHKMGILRDEHSEQKAMDQLTHMYPEAIDASVREITSNAIDATIAAGAKSPIEINFDPMDNNFTVQDFGVGMSYEDAVHYYKYYGATNKAFDMNQIGAKGLGAKAPLAYASEFSVRTVHDSLATSFVISNSAAGHRLDVSYMKRQTDEPNGTKVSIPVAPGDENKFMEVVETYQKYSLDLNIIVNGQVKTDKNDWVKMADILLDEETRLHGRVLMNTTVGFDPDNYKFWLGGWRYDAPNRGNWRKLNEPSLLIELKPGVLNFVSSRDAIINDDKAKTLVDRISEYIRSQSSIDALKIIDSQDIPDHEKLQKVISMTGNYSSGHFTSYVRKELLRKDDSQIDEDVESLSFYPHVKRLKSIKPVLEIIQANDDGKTYEYSHTCSMGVMGCNGRNLVEHFDKHLGSSLLTPIVKFNNNFDQGYPAVIVSGVNEAKIRNLLEFRSGYLRSLEKKGSRINLILLKDGEDTPPELKALFKDVTEVTAEEFIKGGKKWRSDKRKESENPNELTRIGANVCRAGSSYNAIFDYNLDVSSVDVIATYTADPNFRIPYSFIANGLSNIGIDIYNSNIAVVKLSDMSMALLQRLEKEGVRVVFNKPPTRGAYLIEYALKNSYKTSELNLSQVVSTLTESFGKNFEEMIYQMTYRSFDINYDSIMALTQHELPELEVLEGRKSRFNTTRPTHGLFYNLVEESFDSIITSITGKIPKSELTKVKQLQFALANRNLLGEINRTKDKGLRETLIKAIQNSF